MACYFNRTLPIGINEAVLRTADVLTGQLRQYHRDVTQTLQAKIGTMLPCYVVVQGSIRTDIAAIDRAASMQANDAPKQTPERVPALLRKAVEAVRGLGRASTSTYKSKGEGVDDGHSRSLHEPVD